MAGYATDSAVGRRIATLRYDVLTSEPDWLVGEVLQLHAYGALAGTKLDDLVRRVVRFAADVDGAPVRSRQLAEAGRVAAEPGDPRDTPCVPSIT